MSLFPPFAFPRDIDAAVVATLLPPPPPASCGLRAYAFARSPSMLCWRSSGDTMDETKVDDDDEEDDEDDKDEEWRL